MPTPNSRPRGRVFRSSRLRAYEIDTLAIRTQSLVDCKGQRYPELGEVSSLETSAKVIKGEMPWP